MKGDYFMFSVIALVLAMILFLVWIVSTLSCQQTAKVELQPIQPEFNLKSECDTYYIKDIKTEITVCPDFDSGILPAELLYNPKTKQWSMDSKGSK